MGSENVKEATDQNFESEVLGGDKPALVDFWAVWCGPCRAVEPVIKELATEQAGKVNVFKMNVDENAQTPAQYGVRSIPTIILFKDGKVVDQVVGAVPKADLERLISRA